MNKPSQPKPPFEAASPPYELDGYGWAMAQARLLRERRFDELDIENIAEEIESVGRSEASRAESALRVLMAHILKWQHQPERRSRSWSLTIIEQRLRYELVVKENPGLRSRLDQIRDEAYRLARVQAADETDLPLRLFPIAPLDWEAILNEPFDHERL